MTPAKNKSMLKNGSFIVLFVLYQIYNLYVKFVRDMILGGNRVRDRNGTTQLYSG